MAKAVKYFLLSVIVCVGGGLLLFSLMIDTYLKSSIEQTGSEMTGSAVTVESVSVSPLSGRGSINGFRIANPEGFNREDAMTIDQFTIEIDLFTLWSDVIVVREVRISNPLIYVEQQMPDNNLRTILNRLNESVSSETGSFGEIAIDYFLLEGAAVELYTEIGGERSARVEMSGIEMTDLGRGEDGAYSDEVMREIARRVVEQAMQAALRSGASQIRDAFEDIFQ